MYPYEHRKSHVLTGSTEHTGDRPCVPPNVSLNLIRKTFKNPWHPLRHAGENMLGQNFAQYSPPLVGEWESFIRSTNSK
jgi:hypothetical protein